MNNFGVFSHNIDAEVTKKKFPSNFVVFGLLFLVMFLIFPNQTRAYYGDGCEQYGPMAYSSGGYCQCMPGYVFSGDDYLGKTCKSATSVCYDKYGYGAEYDSLSKSCACSYGYVFGKDSLGNTTCITENQSCINQYGYHARSTYGGKCECGYGYVFSGGQCTDGNYVCHSKNGIYSSYNDSSNSCECDSGYTLDDSNQCVKKQNNVYFKLLDVNTDDRQAIIKSEYDSSQYLVTYGIGCYSSSINRYKYRDIVVNLGTDFDLDIWDKIVLPDDDEVCDITHRERTYEDTLQVEEPAISYYIPAPTQPYQPASVTQTDSYAGLTSDERCVKLDLGTFYNTNKQSCDTCSSGTERVAGTNNCQKPVPVAKKTEKTTAKVTPDIKTPEIKKIDHGKISTTSVPTASSTVETGKTKTSWLNKIWKFIWRF